MIEHIIKFPDQYNFTLVGINAVHVFSFPGLRGARGDIGCIVKFFEQEITEGENSIDFTSDFSDKYYEILPNCYNSNGHVEFRIPNDTKTKSGFKVIVDFPATFSGIAIKQGL